MDNRYELWVWQVGDTGWQRVAEIRMAMGIYYQNTPSEWLFYPTRDTVQLVISKANTLAFKIAEIPMPYPLPGIDTSD